MNCKTDFLLLIIYNGSQQYSCHNIYENFHLPDYSNEMSRFINADLWPLTLEQDKTVANKSDGQVENLYSSWNCSRIVIVMLSS